MLARHTRSRLPSNSTTDPSFRIERSTSDQFDEGNGVFTGGNNVPTLRSGDDAVFFLQGTGGFPVGDVNRDGTVDFLDISPSISLLSMGEFQDEADIDQNGSVDFLDIAPFISILGE